MAFAQFNLCQPCCTQPSGNCLFDCSPCKIPKVDLILLWNNNIVGSGSVSLVYTPPGQWNSICNNELLYSLSCPGSLIKFSTTYFLSGFCPTGQEESCQGPGNQPLALSLSSYTCNPLSLQYIVNSSGCPVLYNNGYTSFTITGPSIGADICCQIFLIKGCNNLPVPGAIVSIYDNQGGSLLAQATTPDSGQVALLWNGSCTVYVTVTTALPRFSDYGQLLTLTGDNIMAITLSPLSNYVCFENCSIPVSKTLHVSDSVFGSITIVWGSTNGPNSTPGWTGHPSPQPMVGGCCAPEVGGTLTYKVGNNGVFYGIEGFTPFLIDNNMTVTCYPFNYSKLFSNSNGCGGDAYFTWCTNPVGITITE